MTLTLSRRVLLRILYTDFHENKTQVYSLIPVKKRMEFVSTQGVLCFMSQRTGKNYATERFHKWCNLAEAQKSPRNGERSRRASRQQLSSAG